MVNANGLDVSVLSVTPAMPLFGKVNENCKTSLSGVFSFTVSEARLAKRGKEEDAPVWFGEVTVVWAG